MAIEPGTARAASGQPDAPASAPARPLKVRLADAWIHFWMGLSGRGRLGRVATRLAALAVPPAFGRTWLARLHPGGYVDPTATVAIRPADLRLGAHCFVGERVLLYQRDLGCRLELGERAHIFQECHIQVGEGGSVSIGPDTYIQPRCQLSAYKGPILIGANVVIAPHCAFYSYSHGIAPGQLIRQQPLTSKGGIVIEDDVWLSYGVVVLDGVRIGRGAVIGAGAVVTKDVPANAVAAGVPARVLRYREQGEQMTAALQD